MSHDLHDPYKPIRRIANWILAMDQDQLQVLRELLEQGGSAGVTATIPPDLPLKEGGAEVPFEDWPDDYFESME